jgi:hypothetical protein
MSIPAVAALRGLDLFCQALCLPAGGGAGFTGAVLETIR